VKPKENPNPKSLTGESERDSSHHDANQIISSQIKQNASKINQKLKLF
jgi:hypothetical protein